MQDMLNSRKRGDMAFREKDFRVAIDCYSQVNNNFYILSFDAGPTHFVKHQSLGSSFWLLDE
jgi:hypothetical protein